MRRPKQIINRLLRLFLLLPSLLLLLLDKIQFRIIRRTEHVANFITKGRLLFLSFIHRLNPLNICFSLLIIGGGWAHVKAGTLSNWGEYEIIECPPGYAVEVQPGHYVPCSVVEYYWEREYMGVRTTELEMRSPLKPLTRSMK